MKISLIAMFMVICSVASARTASYSCNFGDDATTPDFRVMVSSTQKSVDGKAYCLAKFDPKLGGGQYTFVKNWSPLRKVLHGVHHFVLTLGRPYQELPMICAGSPPPRVWGCPLENQQD